MIGRSGWSAIGAAVVLSLAASIALPGSGASGTAADGGGTGGVFVPIVPCRLFDTRVAPANVGLRNSPIGNGETLVEPVTGTNGNCSIPTQATAVSMNVTIVNPTSTSYLTVAPSDAPLPLASNLNWVASSPPIPNKVDVKLSADGKIQLFNNAGTVDVIADVVGYYADHNHDDRYYTKPEVDAAVATATAAANAAADAATDTANDKQSSHHQDVYPARAMAIATPGTTNGCLTNAPATSLRGYVPLVLPVGSRLVSVLVRMYDGTSAAQYTVVLTSATTTEQLLLNTPVTTFAGGSQFNKIVPITLTPPTPVIVDDAHSYFLDLGPFTNFDNGFCSAVVTYDTNG